MKVGFIGLGVMGASMAGHILKKLGSVVVWNRTASRGDGLVEGGAVRASSPSQLAASCDIICLCVADTPDVETVMFGEDGVYTSLADGSLIIDFSTIAAAETEEFAKKVAGKNCSWVDAPISGGDVGARNGTLAIMAGGTESDFQRAMPVFEAVGKKIHHMGPVGSGQRTKMANQIACCGTITSMIEALVFARKCGMDEEKVLEAISGGAAGSWSLSNYGPRVLRGDFDPGFSIHLMAKDLRLVADAIERHGGDFPTTMRLKEIYEEMDQDGEGHLGVQAAIKRLGWNG